MKYIYKIVSNRCISSKLIARWLAKSNREYCQCGFDCKIKILHIANDYEYVISGREYRKLVKDKEIKPYN